MNKASVWILVAAAACGSDGGGASVSVEEFFEWAACTSYVECCTPAEFVDQTGTPSEEECVAFTRVLIDMFVQDSIAAGRVEYHGDRAAECLAIIQAASCAERHGSVAPPGGAVCLTIFVGRVAAGGSCGSELDCVSGTHCDGEGDPQNLGACVTTATIGQPCPDFRCVSGAYCDGGGTCRAKQADGAGCSDDDVCESGSCNSGTCGPRLTCDGL